VTDKDKTPIPENHGIREIWELNKLDVYGLIELAKSGDHDAARVLMARYLHLKQLERADREAGVKRISQGDEHPIERYIYDAIELSLKTDDANRGFNLKRPKRSRPKPTYREKRKYLDIGYRVAQLIEQYPSKNQAYEAAAEELHISKEKAALYYKKYFAVCK
jgi:hypothetical protein